MALRHSRRFPFVLLLSWCYLFVAFMTCPGRRQRSFLLVDSAVTDGRHSYSLTTFNPDGKLGQVERALVAASLGTPIVGVIKGSDIIFASPQILPSPLMNDDGTPRFSVVSPQIILGHSGIASDGRVVMESAQRLAIEHSYTYDEPIPIGLFLEELSLLFQAYTMKPGARPFGCTLLVGYLPPSRFHSSTNRTEKPRLFQIDCSGSVVELDTVAVINGKFNGDMKTKLFDFANEDNGNPATGGLNNNNNNNNNNSKGQDRESISRILQEGLQSVRTNNNKGNKRKKSSRNQNISGANGTDDVVKLPMRIISATLSPAEGFKVERRMVANRADHKIQ